MGRRKGVSVRQRNWHEIGGQLPIPKLVRDLIRFENEAIAIYNYEPLLLPGLAQTADYARALMAAFPGPISPETLEGMVAARINRQRVLDRAAPPQLHLIIEEMALRRTMGAPEMMYGQLQHLLATAARRNVSLRVLPFNTEAAVATQGSLIILDCPEQPTLCFEESRSTAAFLEDEKFIGMAGLAWKKLSDAAWSEEDSRQLIVELASKLRK